MTSKTSPILFCASAFLPCFINRFVNSSNNGSVLGGLDWTAYPGRCRALPCPSMVGLCTGASAIEVDNPAARRSALISFLSALDRPRAAEEPDPQVSLKMSPRD